MADDDTLVSLTAEVTAAFVANNTVSSGEVPALIAAIHGALAGLGEEPAPVEPEYVGAVSVRKSLANPDAIISMIDGKPYKALKRHLAANGLTPAEYRARYSLAGDYPMVAPSYSEKRASLAKAIGLGRKMGEAVAKAAETVVEAVTPAAAPAKPAARGRKKLGIAEAKAAAKTHLGGE